MPPPDPLTQLLAFLSRTLDDGTDLNAILSVLTDDLHAAITSYLGFTLTVPIQDELVTLDLMSDGAAGASLRIPFPLLPNGSDATGQMVIFAASPGAFADLAAQIRQTYHLDTQIQVDAHLKTGRPMPQDLLRILGERSDINQAIGVLIQLGYPPEQTGPQLHLRAGRSGTSVHQVAQKLLSDASLAR